MQKTITRRLTFGFAKSRSEDEEPSVPTYNISNEKARSLGISFTPLEVSFNDTVESLKEKGFFKD